MLISRSFDKKMHVIFAGGFKQFTLAKAVPQKVVEGQEI